MLAIFRVSKCFSHTQLQNSLYLEVYKLADQRSRLRHWHQNWGIPVQVVNYYGLDAMRDMSFGKLSNMLLDGAPCGLWIWPVLNFLRIWCGYSLYLKCNSRAQWVVYWTMRTLICAGEGGNEGDTTVERRPFDMTIYLKWTGCSYFSWVLRDCYKGAKTAQGTMNLLDNSCRITATGGHVGRARSLGWPVSWCFHSSPSSFTQ